METVNSVLNWNVGGVPEHFNLPWVQTAENESYSTKNGSEIKLHWKDFGGGTGQMCEALRNGTLDIAILLTEGALKDISKGNASKIVSHYVESPLQWGVHTGFKSTFDLNNLPNQLNFLISRYTSGSHLMAFLYAQKLGYHLDQVSFTVVGDLNGAIKELEANPNQLFLWEKFTTQPHVTNQTMVRLDVFPTPWAPFVVVVSDKILEEHSEVVNEIINTVQSKAQALKNNSDSYKEFAKVYDLTESEVQEWLNLVHWSSSGRLDNEVFEKVKSALVGIGEIKKEFEVKNALHHLNQSKTLLV